MHAQSSRVVQRSAIPVEILLTDGSLLRAKIFVPVQGRLSDVLNDERPFLPLETEGQFLALAKASIRHVTLPRTEMAPRPSKCPYAALGLQEGAPFEEVKRAYRQLCAAHHPDRVKGAGLAQDFVDLATQNMARINNAYEQILKRAQLS